MTRAHHSIHDRGLTEPKLMFDERRQQRIRDLPAVGPL
jgi:hypothetical protein